LAFLETRAASSSALEGFTAPKIPPGIGLSDHTGVPWLGGGHPGRKPGPLSTLQGFLSGDMENCTGGDMENCTTFE
jgi:hypothetical protein